MLGNATLARYTTPPESPNADYLNNIEHAARRAADLCQQMLAYAGKTELCAQPMNISELVRSTAALLRVSIHKNIRLDLQLDDTLPAVHADSAQLQQIVMNLVINAADAIGDKMGVIAVTTFQRQVDAAHFHTALHRPDLPGGCYVGLEVRDNGCGMTAATLSRIFEPFFTTKFSGRGLGLASVMGIVQSHRGALFVDSEVGRGSTFRLMLQAQGVVATSPEPSKLAPKSALRGNILVVDDEDVVRDILGTVLRRHGLTPILASSGEEALQVYDQFQNNIPLVILDLTMPGLSGEETLRELRQRNPGQRVLVMSGYSDQDIVRRCTALGLTDFIAKPFELPTLLKKLQSIAA
jgi:CheY-like chemotaxis protein